MTSPTLPEPDLPKLYMYYGPIEGLTGRDWPHIPDKQRLIRAHARIDFEEQDGAMWAVPNIAGTNPWEQRDVTIMAEWYKGQAHRLKALLRYDLEKPGNSDEMFDFLFQLAEEADTGCLMGLSVESDVPEYESEKVWLNFDAVPKDPEWMGISYTWEYFRRTEVMVIESRITPGLPGLIIGMPVENAGDTFRSGHNFPEGVPSQVRDLLKWHQATRVHWYGITC